MEWKGSLYPEDLPHGEMLTYYSGKLNAVEINSTFYRMPSTKVREGCASQVPEEFSCVLKASRRITHRKTLRDAGDEFGYLLSHSSKLGSRLGPILFQLPPSFKKDAPRLREFLVLLPEGVRAEFGFGSSSWGGATTRSWSSWPM